MEIIGFFWFILVKPRKDVSYDDMERERLV